MGAMVAALIYPTLSERNERKLILLTLSELSESSFRSGTRDVVLPDWLVYKEWLGRDAVSTADRNIELILLCYDKRIFSINSVVRTTVSYEMAYFATYVTLLFCKLFLKFLFFIFNKTKTATCNSVEFYKIVIRLFNMLRNFDVR